MDIIVLQLDSDCSFMSCSCLFLDVDIYELQLMDTIIITGLLVVDRRDMLDQ